MSSRAIEAAKAFVRISGDTSGLTKAFASVSSMLKGFGGSVLSVMSGSLLADGFTKATAAVFDFASSGAAIDDIANRTGASAEALSQLKYAAEQSGASIEDVEKGGRKLGQVLTDAGNGSKAAATALSAVGLTAEHLSGLSLDEQLKAVAEGLKTIEDPGARASAAMDLFGKSGANLVPLMEDGAAGITKLMNEADQLGLTLSGEQATAAASFDDAWAKLQATLGNVGKIIGTAVAPVLTTLLNIATQAIPTIINLGQQLGTAIATGASIAWQALSELMPRFTEFLGEHMRTLKAIGQALLSGEWSLAAKIYWLRLKAVWIEGTEALLFEWKLWKKGFLDTFNEAMTYVQERWAKLQNTLSNGVVKFMAFFDSSINVDAVSAELDAMMRQQLQQIDRTAQANQAARDSAFQEDIGQVNSDLEQARAEWQQAVTQAENLSSERANEPSVADTAGNKFDELIKSMQAGDIATRINDSVKKSNNNNSQDLRTAAGAEIITKLWNSTGELSKQQTTILKDLRKLQARQLVIAERGSQVIHV